MNTSRNQGLSFAATGLALAFFVAGLALAGSNGEASDLLDLPGAALAQLPSVWVLTRLTVAMVGLGANLPEDAVYPHAAVDRHGRPLDGANRYVIHFAPGDTRNAISSAISWGSP